MKFALAAWILVSMGCTKIKTMTATNHKVTFDVEVVSTNGKKPLRVECFDADALKSYLEAQTAAFMSGKPSSLEAPKPVTYTSPDNPGNQLQFTLELPSRNTACMIGLKAIPIQVGDKSGDVFKPTGDTTLKVKYNMYTLAMFKVPSDGAKVEIIR